MGDILRREDASSVQSDIIWTDANDVVFLNECHALHLGGNLVGWFRETNEDMVNAGLYLVINNRAHQLLVSKITNYLYDNESGHSSGDLHPIYWIRSFSHHQFVIVDERTIDYDNSADSIIYSPRTVKNLVALLANFSSAFEIRVQQIVNQLSPEEITSLFRDNNGDIFSTNLNAYYWRGHLIDDPFPKCVATASSITHEEKKPNIWNIDLSQVKYPDVNINSLTRFQNQTLYSSYLILVEEEEYEEASILLSLENTKKLSTLMNDSQGQHADASKARIFILTTYNNPAVEWLTKCEMLDYRILQNVATVKEEG